jgi:hypothetical protein
MVADGVLQPPPLANDFFFFFVFLVWALGVVWGGSGQVAEATPRPMVVIQPPLSFLKIF